MTHDEIEALIAEADRLCEVERYDEAFKLDLKAAEAGDPRAKTHLGWYYENGLGTTRDIAAAIKWYSEAAEQGMSDALRALYALKKAGVGLHSSAVFRKAERDVDEGRILYVDNDYTGAISMAQASADAGDAKAKYLIAQCLEKLGDNSGRGLRLLTEAADDGFTSAMILLGKRLLDTNPQLAVEYFKKAADTNSPQAFYELGRCFEFGIGVSPNLHEAFSYYNQAYHKAYGLSAARLAHFYKDGTVVSPDSERYRLLIKEGCRFGDSDSLYHYALDFYNDHASAPGEESAELFRKAAAAGSLNAKLFLAKHVLYGWTSSGDKFQSKKELLEAAEAGNALACYILGECFAKGLEGYFDIDYKKSGDYFMKCAGDENTANAYYRSGMSYLNADRSLAEKAFITGIDHGLWNCAEAYIQYIISDSWMLTHKRHKTAEEFNVLTRCADLGIARAYFEVGICHCYGWGTPEDLNKAFENFSIGAQKDDINSVFMLAWCYRSGIGTKKNTAQAAGILKKRISRGPDPLLLCGLALTIYPHTIEEHTQRIALFRQAIDMLPSADKATTAFVVISWAQHQDIHSKNANRLYPSYTQEGREEIIAMLKLVVEWGCIKAMVALANYYNKFKSTQAEALPLLKKAAEAGDSESMYLLYVNSEDINEKKYWLHQAAKTGYVPAYLALGLNYLRGINSFEKDIPKAIPWLEKGVEADNADAMYYLGYHYFKSSSAEERSKGLELLKKSAPRHSGALADVASYYYKNPGPDTDEAIKWLTMAMNYYFTDNYNYNRGIKYRTLIAKLKRKPSPLNVFIELYENFRDECIILWRDLRKK